MRECICRTRITYIHIFIFPVSTGGTGGATATRHPLIPKVACAVRPRNRAQCARCIRCAAHAVRGVALLESGLYVLTGHAVHELCPALSPYVPGAHA
jgi:hypothetical protein